jgi:hypothetical protein
MSKFNTSNSSQGTLHVQKVLLKKFWLDLYRLWPDYSAFEGEYADGGFNLGTPAKGSILVIIYSEDIEATKQSKR